LISADDVARFLSENPDFFEEHSELLSKISVTNPYGGSAIALSARQVLTLREKSKTLEGKLAELIQYGEENDAISAKMHRLSVALLGTKDLSAALSALYYNLREDFAVPNAALRVWRGYDAASRALTVPEFRATSDELVQYATGLEQPYCGPSASAEVAGWFGEAAPHVRSVALMQLKDHDCFGLLALGSDDVLRFYPEMGTVYLQRLGELASAALARYL